MNEVTDGQLDRQGDAITSQNQLHWAGNKNNLIYSIIDNLKKSTSSCFQESVGTMVN